MSAAWRSSKTGEGDQAGKRGAFATELWIVQTDTEFDDPLPVLARHRPMGSEHSTATFKSARVVDYQKLEKTDNPVTWRMLVIYQTEQMLGGGSFGGWRVSTRWETRTDHMVRSLPTAEAPDGVLIGPHHYRIYDETTEPPPTAYTHIAPDPTTGVDVQLVQSKGIKPVGFDRVTVAMHFTFSATVGTMSFSLLRYLGAKFGGKVNSVRWKGFPPASLLFTGFTEDEMASAAASNLNPINVYPVNVEFAYNPKLWTPATFVDTYTTGGIEVAVQQSGLTPSGPDAGALVLSTYDVYETAPLGDVFTVLGSGKVPTDPPKGGGRG